MLAAEPFLPAMRDEPFSLDAAYRSCREVVRVHSKTFFVSSLFLRGEKRRAIWSLYAVCRIADDIADRAEPQAARLAAIDAWERAILAAYEGRPRGAVLHAFADVLRRYEIPIEPVRALLRGVRFDVTTNRYQSFEALREYCYLVASTVGLMVMPVLGAGSAGAGPYAVALGRAMQMTNILRDVGEDARLGRIYLPLDDLRRFGVSEASILAGTPPARFVPLMQFEIERVRAMYREAMPGIDLLSHDARYTVRLALTLYRAILDRIERNAYDVFGRRAHVPLAGKLSAVLGTALRRSI